jgi:protein SCO1/2
MLSIDNASSRAAAAALRWIRMFPRIAFGAGIALLVLAGGAWLLLRGPPKAAPAEPFIEVHRDAYVLAEPEALPAFRLTGHDGKPFDNAALRGRWTLLFFGFAHCPDVCPTTLAVFAEAFPGLGRDVRFVLVSVDPERDTPEVLRKYVTAFHPAFLGTAGDVSALAESLGVVYAKVPGPAPGGYSVDHSSSVLLIDPQGRFYGVLAAPHVAANIVQALPRMQKHQ